MGIADESARAADGDERRPPLAGVRVLDLTRFIAGPYCTMLLADQGATVVKVEQLEGEDTRALHPLLGEEEQVSAYFLRYNRSKRSVCIDLKQVAGREVFERLVSAADVLVENFRPGVLERLGLGWERLSTINPRLVYCTITGFGYTPSPLRDRGAFTPIVEAMSGGVIYRSRTDPPSIAGYPVGDLFPAGLATSAIAMALYRREHDGRGARIDMAMYDAMLSMNERAIGMSAMLGRDQLPGLPTDLGSAPSGVFRASDGFITLAVVGEPIWQRLCRVLERPDWADDPELASGPARAERDENVVRPGIEAWLSTRTREEAVRTLNDAGVPAGEVARPLEVLEAEQPRRRGMILEYPAYGGVSATVTGNPLQFAGEAPAEVGPAPGAGEHTTEILGDWAGLDAAGIDELERDGVIARREVRR